MLQIVMGLEERIACEEFDEYAPDTPYIAGIAPSKIEYDFRSAVVPSRYHARMILIIEGGRAKIYESDFRV